MVVLDAAAVASALDALAAAIAARPGDGPWAIVGIRKGGEPLAERIATKLKERLPADQVVSGTVDITLYRDDGFGPHDWPQVGVTNLPFEPKRYTVVLVDDVLYTGRTVRSAVDVVLDYGRPKAIRLAVLIDRGLRELPIAADFVGRAIDTTAEQHVDVQLREHGATTDAVIVAPKKVRT